MVLGLSSRFIRSCHGSARTIRSGSALSFVFRLRPVGATDRAESDVGFPDVQQTAESSVVATESANADSEAVRSAIGQLFGYRRHIEAEMLGLRCCYPCDPQATS